MTEKIGSLLFSEICNELLITYDNDGEEKEEVALDECHLVSKYSKICEIECRSLSVGLDINSRR